MQSVNNYRSLREQQEQDISSILSWVANVGNGRNARTLLSSQETISFNLKQDAINPFSSLFPGNSITGGTFNIYISSASFSASNTMIGASPKPIRNYDDRYLLKVIAAKRTARKNELKTVF